MALKTITVADLIDLLKDEAPDARVIITADYGDRCHTEQALPLRGDCDTVTIRESGYSASGYAIDDEGVDGEDEDTYLVIR